MKIFVAMMLVLWLCGCSESQSAGERFRILQSVTTYAKHGDDVVELTLPEGCEVIVVAVHVPGDSKQIAQRSERK